MLHEAIYYDDDIGIEYIASRHLHEESRELMGTRKLEEMTAEEIKELRLPDGQRLPTLDEMIPLFTGTDKTLILEMKGYNVLDILAGRLKKAFSKKELTAEQVVVVSFDHLQLARVRTVLPNVKIGAIFVHSDKPTTAVFPWIKEAKSKKIPFNKETAVKAMKELQPEYVVLPHQEISGETIYWFAKVYPSIPAMFWVFTETPHPLTHEMLDEDVLMEELKEASEKINLDGIMIDTPEKAPLYKKYLQNKPE